MMAGGTRFQSSVVLTKKDNLRQSLLTLGILIIASRPSFRPSVSPPAACLPARHRVGVLGVVRVWVRVRVGLGLLLELG